MTDHLSQSNRSLVREADKFDRPVGLLGGVSLVIGGVIGMGIYALISQVAAQVGTTIWLAFSLAILISVVGVFPLIQISSALPRAGAGYIYASRLLSPLWGVVVSWWVILGAACSTAFVSMGMAGYLAPYLPFQIPVGILAIMIPAFFLGLYCFGLRLATWLQIILTAGLVVALLVYGIKGAAVKGMVFTVSLPQGVGGLILACIISYSACFGFQVIAEMGEEIKNAKKTIPLSMLIGGAIILVIYIVVGTVFASSIPYDKETIKSMTAPLMETGKLFLSAPAVILLSFGALAAGLTSLNAGAIALPRELFSQARDGILPAFIGRLSPSTRTPLNAVLAYFGIVFLLLVLDMIFNIGIDFFSVMTAIGILLMTAMISIGSLFLPRKFPEYYEKAYFTFPRPVLLVLVIVAVITSLGFVFLVLTELPSAGLAYLIFTIAIVVFYYFRLAAIRKQGIDWEDRMTKMPGFDEEV